MSQRVRSILRIVQVQFVALCFLLTDAGSVPLDGDVVGEVNVGLRAASVGLNVSLHCGSQHIPSWVRLELA